MLRPIIKKKKEKITQAYLIVPVPFTTAPMCVL